MPMDTVGGMGKRIFTLAAGAVVGAVAFPALLHLAFLWGLFPNRNLNQASAYVRQVMQIVNQNYVAPNDVTYSQLAQSAIHGMVDNLDPHSEFLDSKDNQELEQDLSGEFGGIGVQVDLYQGRIVVISPTAGGPGERAGIRGGDQIIAIDGRPVGPSPEMDEVVDKLRGKPHTQVRLGLFRPSTGRRLDLTVTREVIKEDSVTDSRVIDGDVGYIQISDFSDQTGTQFIDALNRLLAQRIDSLVIDLRNNPGGLLDAAVEVAEPFFKKGELVVYTQGRSPGDREDYDAESDDQPLDLPVAVLINAETASAAEIVTGALKDTGRAVVVGERSFGKGSVQDIFKLKDGQALRLTIAHYYTPSGVSIDGKGITPQVRVVLTADEDFKLYQQLSRPDLSDPKEYQERFGVAPIPDRQLQAAVDVLRGVDLLDAQAQATAAGQAK
jgi:carboxyl-terminal processing protease